MKLRSRTQFTAVLAATVSSICIGGFCQAQTTTKPGMTPSAKDAKRMDLPKAEKLRDMAIEAMGGKTKLENIKSQSIKATMSASGQNISLDAKWAAPKDESKDVRFHVVQSMMGMNIPMGSDGETVWMQNPMAGYQVLEGPQAQQATGIVDLIRLHTILLDEEKKMISMETVEETTFNGKAAYKVKTMVKAEDEGAEPEERFVFFDKNNHLMIGMDVTEQGQAGKVMFEDYETVGDLQLFKTMKMQQGPMTMEMKYDEIGINNVEDSAFELPEEVKAKMADKPSMPEMPKAPAGVPGG